MRKVLLVLAVGFVIAAFFGLHWAILTGRAKRQRADAEYYALQNLRGIYHAERQYYANHEFLGFTCALSTLGGKPDQFLDDTLASGHAGGYTFTLSNCKHEENVGFNGNLTYLTASPDPGSPFPLRTFCVEDDVDSIPRGEVIFDHPQILASAPGSSTCTQPLQ